jgi:hypothetical protein
MASYIETLKREGVSNHERSIQAVHTNYRNYDIFLPFSILMFQTFNYSYTSVNSSMFFILNG